MTKTIRLIEKFGRQITQGDYTPGAALPSEAELCERFNVSRNVMREVIKVLSAKRLIDAQPHRGLFVMPRDQWNYLDADLLAWALEKGDDPELIASLLDIRSLIEPTISRWAAERATAVDLVAIETAWQGMADNQHEILTFHEYDIAFHKAIILATHNVVICQLSDAIGAFQRTIFAQTLLPEPGHMNLTVREHLGLFEAIRCRNPQEAETASRRMVERTAFRSRENIANKLTFPKFSASLPDKMEPLLS